MNKKKHGLLIPLGCECHDCTNKRYMVKILEFMMRGYK